MLLQKDSMHLKGMSYQNHPRMPEVKTRQYPAAPSGEESLLLMESLGDKRIGTLQYCWQYWFLLWYVSYIYESLGKAITTAWSQSAIKPASGSCRRYR